MVSDTSWFFQVRRAPTDQSETNKVALSVAERKRFSRASKLTFQQSAGKNKGIIAFAFRVPKSGALFVAPQEANIPANRTFWRLPAMKKIQLTRKFEAALLLAVTVPFIGMQAWALGETIQPATNVVKTQTVTGTVAQGPSLGGPILDGPVLGSNEQFTPPNLGDPLEDATGAINTGFGAFQDSIAGGGDIKLGNTTIPGDKILIDENGEITDGRDKRKIILDPFMQPQDEVNPQTGQTPIEESADAVAQPDPAAGTTPQEEAAEALSGEPEPGSSGNGSGSGSGNGTGTGTANGGGSGGIFQDPTKGGPGLGIENAVEALDNRIPNRNINVNEEIVGGGIELQNTNAGSFGAFEGAASPFAAANTGALELPAGEAVNAGVARSFSAKGATNIGAENIPVEEGNLVVRSAKTNALNNASLPELEVDGHIHINPSISKVRVNAVLPELNEITVAPRR